MSEQSANPGVPHPHKDLVKPEEIQKVAFLDGAAKAKYTQVFRGFWQILNTKPVTAPEYKHAFEQLSSASLKLKTMANEHRRRMAAQQGQGGQGAQQQQQQQQQQAQSAGQQSNAHPGQQAQQANGQAVPARPTANQFSQAIIKHVKEYPYQLPLSLVQGTPEAEAKLKELRTGYATHLQKQETASNQLKQIESMIQQTRSKQQNLPPQLVQKKAELENTFRASQSWVEQFKNSQNALKQAVAKALQGEAQAPQVKTEQAAPPNRPPTAPNQQIPGSQAANTPLQVQTANVRAEASRSTQSPATAQSQGPQHNQPPTPTTQPQQQQNQQQPTPINGNMAFGQAQMMRPGMSQMQQASPQTNGPPVALTHSAAMANAQRSYSERQAGTPNQPTSPHNLNNRERETQSHPKMPIPKTINTGPPAPVAVTPGRPTMGGTSNAAPGMMGQSVLNKLPQYMLEGDGERVLSKKKLDELVRQVTGAGDNATGDSLTPEVEETMLQLADDFVDEIITQACRLSKLRESHQLDIRDLQLVLERKYNIRVPGYASDEIRTVRKLHPAPGWNEKMKALQAAKIMNGKTDT